MRHVLRLRRSVDAPFFGVYSDASSDACRVMHGRRRTLRRVMRCAAPCRTHFAFVPRSRRTQSVELWSTFLWSVQYGLHLAPPPPPKFAPFVIARHTDPTDTKGTLSTFNASSVNQG